MNEAAYDAAAIARVRNVLTNLGEAVEALDQALTNYDDGLTFDFDPAETDHHNELGLRSEVEGALGAFHGALSLVPDALADLKSRPTREEAFNMVQRLLAASGERSDPDHRRKVHSEAYEFLIRAGNIKPARPVRNLRPVPVGDGRVQRMEAPGRHPGRMVGLDRDDPQPPEAA